MTRTNALLNITILLLFTCCETQTEQIDLPQVESKTETKRDDFVIIDLTQKQLNIFNEYQDEDSTKRMKVCQDSLYFPYQGVWNGYVNGIGGFNLTMHHYGFLKVDSLNERLLHFYANSENPDLVISLLDVRENMLRFTGHDAIGEWYLIYGPALANLGSVGDGKMFIDLSYPDNRTAEDIVEWFPHELNHQIHDRLKPDDSYSVLSRTINEGFATYVNWVYWNSFKGNSDYTAARSLAYSEAEYTKALQEWELIYSVFLGDIMSEDKAIINKYGAVNQKLSPELPGKIGYFIGFRIVEEYVKRNGKDSWKDLYFLPYQIILDKSGFYQGFELE
ncbi:MAG: DUF2268 domain-containing putative Zn-dependent protease [Bacteroidota bacterium]